MPDQARLAELSKFDNFPNFGISHGPIANPYSPEAGTPPTLAGRDALLKQVSIADRLTLAEKKYLRGMADLGAGPHRSGDIAASLGRKVSTLAPLRSALIDKGMIYSPNHGDTAFTVPLFDEFMRRIMPGDDWRMD